MKKISALPSLAAAGCLAVGLAAPCLAQSTAIVKRSVPIYAVDGRGIGARLGTIELRDVTDGLRLKIELENLPPGQHGFHVHSIADCSPAQIGGRVVPAGAAGPPYDPFHTGHHAGPHGNGYLGDLPFIAVPENGKAKYTMVAPRLKVDDMRNRALLITAGGDNYSDTPPMGGGGDAIACGMVR
jgi:Cu-Zn family superoxide dismutase